MINKLKNRFKLKYLKYVIIFIIIVVLIYGFWLFYNNKIDKSNEFQYKELKITGKIATDKKFQDLDITNIKLYKRGKLTIIGFDIVNNTSTIYKGKNVNAIFLDKKNKVLYKDIIPLQDIGVNETMEIELSLDEDIEDISNFLLSEE